MIGKGSLPTMLQRLPSVKWQQFSKYGFTGVLNTGTDFLIFSVLSLGLSFDLLLANILAFSFAVTQSYFINRYWTFSHSPNAHENGSFVKFIAINMVGLVVSSLVLILLTDSLGVVLAKLSAIVVVLFWGYLMSRKYVFYSS